MKPRVGLAPLKSASASAGQADFRLASPSLVTRFLKVRTKSRFQLWVELHGVGKVGNGPVVIALREINEPSEDMGSGIIGSKSNRLRAVRQGAVINVHHCVSPASLVVRLGVVRLQRNRLLEIVDRRVRRVACQERNATTVVRLGESFIACYRLAEVPLGLVELAPLQVINTATIGC